MQIPPSFGLAFEVERATGKELQKWAGERLRNEVCAPNQFLFDDRLKTEEAALAKALYGPFRSLRVMPDLYAALVVVPTLNEIELAVSAIQASFPASKIIRRRKGDPERFIYDDIHLHARLDKIGAGVITAGVRDRVFEIQVRTGLQYAWWRATHDQVYKGGRSWNLVRVASQVRGSLELLDSVLADLDGSAALQTQQSAGADETLEKIQKLLELWDDDRLPQNAAGFTDAVIALLAGAESSVDYLRELLEGDRGIEYRAERAIPPLQAILGLLVETFGPDFLGELKKKSRFVLVTDEFVEFSDAASTIALECRVSLSDSAG